MELLPIRSGGAAWVCFLLLAALLQQQMPQAHAAWRGLASQEETASEFRKVNPDAYWLYASQRAEPSEPSKTPTATLPGSGKSNPNIAPYAPTPMPVVERMLELAEVSSGDVVYDLGSGDGRVVIMAAQKYGAKAVGIEINDRLVKGSSEKIRELRLDGLATIIKGNLLQADIKPATVVFVYLLPQANEKIRPLLEKNLKPGARVIAHDFRFLGWQWEKTADVEVDGAIHHLYLYRISGAVSSMP